LKLPMWRAIPFINSIPDLSIDPAAIPL
jgi:hypothetical protein